MIIYNQFKPISNICPSTYSPNVSSKCVSYKNSQCQGPTSNIWTWQPFRPWRKMGNLPFKSGKHDSSYQISIIYSYEYSIQEKDRDTKPNPPIRPWSPGSTTSEPSNRPGHDDLQMAIRFFRLCAPPYHWPFSFGECVRVRDDVPMCTSSRMAIWLGRHSGGIWVFANRLESSFEIWVFNTFHVPCVQWDQAAGLGLGSPLGQDAEWEGFVGCSGVQYEYITVFGSISSLGHELVGVCP